MTHRSKVQRYISRTKFKLKKSPLSIGKREKFFSREYLERNTQDTNVENLFQQKKAKSKGRIKSFKFSKSLIKPLNIRKTTEFNFRNMFKGLFNV